MHDTRESWLQAASDALVTRFAGDGLQPQRTRVGVGFTSQGKRGKRIGECWSESASADATREVILSATLDDPSEVLATLAHELIHATLPADAKHGPQFKTVALAIGLQGKMRATEAGPMLLDILSGIIEDLGPYPHARLNVALSGKKTQTTRMLKVECPQCGYTVRTTRQWLDLGAPMCPEGDEMSEEPS